MPEEIYQNIYRIQVPLPGNPLKMLNSYLIKGDGSHLLIDTGFRQPECRLALLNALKELKVRREDVDVFGTHIHSDHIGLAPEIVGPGRNIYIGREDAKLLSFGEGRQYWKDMDEKFAVEGFPLVELDELVRTNPARNLGPPLDYPYKTVRGGDCFQVGRYNLEVIDAPGHTPGQVCLWIKQEGIMFTADHILFDITPNIAMWPSMPDALGSYLDGLRRFRQFNVKLALPGHRETGDYYRRIDELLAHHRHRVEETYQIVRKNPGMQAYEISGWMSWKIKAKNWEAFPLIQKWFAVGECLSHLDYLRGMGKILRKETNSVHRYYSMEA